jgi:epoxyqueuosine reductase QueG
MPGDTQIIDEIREKAIEFGADLAGSVPAGLLEGCPSAQAAGPPGFSKTTGTVIVLGLYHDPEKPEMDWWEEGRATPGDRVLRDIARRLAAWLEDLHHVQARVIPYQIYDGGTYLKDAAVLAGLGRIGRNNLVITPRFGPRVRFRALWVDIETGPVPCAAFVNPCDTCNHPCESECPQDALESGVYSRDRCMARMERDRNAPIRVEGKERKGEVIDHCRTCELACPAGRE